jgi:hypothetical protein
LGRLISIDFKATLNGTMRAKGENMNTAQWVNNTYMNAIAWMNVDMLDGGTLPLTVTMRVPKTDFAHCAPHITELNEPQYTGPDSYNGTDSNDTWKSISYNTQDKLNPYIGTGTVNLTAHTNGQGWLQGSASFWYAIATYAFSNATITYTYDDARCLSGYKLDGCTGLPLSGWNITVNNTTKSWTETTDSNGFWRVCNLENDTYTVCETLKSGWAQRSLPVCYEEALAGINLTNINLTNQKMYCISGCKLDSCAKAGLSGWNITLTNATHNLTRQTGADGKYEFCNLKPGDYTITEEIGSGYVPMDEVSIDIELNCTNLSGQNFTNQKLLCISGYKLDDCTDRGIAGWNVTINNSTFRDDTQTDSTGRYEFCGLVPGNYTLTEDTPDGYISAGQVSIDATLDCDQNLTGQNFTNQKLLCISGHKKNTCGEFNLSNWTIVLSDGQGAAKSVRTNETGYYQFCGLAP